MNIGPSYGQVNPQHFTVTEGTVYTARDSRGKIVHPPLVQLLAPRKSMSERANSIIISNGVQEKTGVARTASAVKSIGTVRSLKR